MSGSDIKLCDCRRGANTLPAGFHPNNLVVSLALSVVTGPRWKRFSSPVLALEEITGLVRREKKAVKDPEVRPAKLGEWSVLKAGWSAVVCKLSSVGEAEPVILTADPLR